ncbi:MAG: hypothetical protein Q9195_004703 [Heterodermia aff. obscurata]
MASSRMMRSSRLASPMDTAPRDSVSAKREVQKTRDKQTSLGDWVEPPLRTPAPSFEDYKGLERQGVLEHMAPLGSFPNHKAKQRVKALNGPRRTTLSRNIMMEDEAATPEPTAPSLSHRSESRKSESRSSNAQNSRLKDEDQDYTPSNVTKPAATKAASSQVTPNTVFSRSSTKDHRLRVIVESAVKRADELKNPYLGKALRELYNRSLRERTVAELLDAVLSMKPTEKQTSDFQAMVKLTRREIKDAEQESLRQSSKTPGSNSKTSLKSPTKSDGGNAAHRGVTAEEVSDAPGSKTNRDTNLPSSKQRSKRMETNGTPSKAERPTKRMRRTYSDASSTSSLSSLTSDNFQRSPRPTFSKDPFANNGPPPLPPPEYRHLGLGPKLHTFPLNRSKSANKLPVTSTPPADVPADEIAARRRQLQKKFEYTVSDSAVRDVPTAKPPQQRRKSHQVGSPLPLRTQQSRLRNGVHRHDLGDDHEFPSSSSSYHGELLAPPTADGHMVTRGGTPNQLGRPPKHGKKSARIKMS